MKFHCTNCDKRMKSEGAFGAGGGAMSVAAFCPNCGNRFALWANPGETLLLKALNAGLAGGELMTQVLESAEATLTHAVDQAPFSGSKPAGDWSELAEEWVRVEPGSFVMGSPETEAGRDTDESPQHDVTITAGFDLGKYTVTRGQWEEVMGTSPWEGRISGPSSPTLPAVFISWDDVQELISRLNAADGGWRYRLPTEAEWEYACRAGTTTMWSFGEDRHAWATTPGMSTAKRRPWTRHPGRWERSCRTRGACKTCTATCGSGARMSTERTTTQSRRPSILGDPTASSAHRG